MKKNQKKTEKKMENAEFQRIDKARKMLNFSSFSELARAVGVSSQTFTDIKKGNHGISRKLAEAIHAIDGRISVAWLMTGDGEAVVVGDGNVTVGNGIGNTNTVTKSDPAVVKALDALGKSQEQIDRLLAIIEKLTD